MKTNFKQKKLITTGGAVLAACVLLLSGGTASAASFDLISSASAAEQGKGNGAQGAGQGKKGASDGGMGGSHAGSGKGGSINSKIFRAVPAVGEEEDSDRPDWAGVKGGKSGGGGKPFDAGTKKGDLFGDMYILLRDENGVPVLLDGNEQVIAFIYDDTGALVPLLDADGARVVIPRNEEGDLLTSMTIGETTYDVYPGEVELGRLSVSRSPTKVIEHALDEALTKLTAPDAEVTLDASGRLVVNGVTIDSPLENLALYDTYMTTDSIPGVTLPAGFDPASLLAAAADKTGTIQVDTVVYINSILGINTPTSYYDYSDYNYDRTATWESVSVTVLVYDEVNNVYVPTPVNVYETLFSSTQWEDSTEGGADDFAAATDDYLQVLEFLHANEVR
jgi:hypothetical protein